MPRSYVIMLTRPCNVDPRSSGFCLVIFLHGYIYIYLLFFVVVFFVFCCFFLGGGWGWGSKAVQTCTHSLYFEQKSEQIKTLQLKIVICTAIKIQGGGQGAMA